MQELITELMTAIEKTDSALAELKTFVSEVSSEVAEAAEPVIEAHITPHVQNLPTYFGIAAVIVLTAIVNVIDFIAEHIERLPEYRLRLQLAKVRALRSIVRFAIRLETARLVIGSHLTAIIDRVFCLV